MNLISHLDLSPWFQFQVYNEEIKKINEKIRELYPANQNPKLAYIIVQKRHHFRAEWLSGNEAFNPPIGTYICDEVVDNLGIPNFYLYTHKSTVGIARPGHYQVYFNNLPNMTLQDLARFTLGLSHLHAACQKTISIPVCITYADKACGRVGECYEGRRVHQDLACRNFMVWTIRFLDQLNNREQQ